MVRSHIPEQKIERIMLAIDAEECRRSLKHFIKGAWHLVEPSARFVDGMPIDAMVMHLEALTRGDIKRLLINIPPRCAKSTICNVIWRAWTWTQDPSFRFMSASYSLDLSTRDNRRCRNLIESSWFQERFSSLFTIASDQHQKRFFENDKKGYHLATSIGGTVTGQGGDFLVIDDAHSVFEAYSAVDRLNALTFFREVWTSRLNSQETGRMLNVGQRVHDEDVSNYIIKERPDWTCLILPAEYEPSRKIFTSIGWSDPRTEPGELLWPERFSKETLEGLKRDLGSIGYAAQYQQTPVPSEGGQVKQQWIRYFTEEAHVYRLEKDTGTVIVPKEECWRFGVVDLAISTKQTADYTVMQLYDVTPQYDLLLIEQIRDRLDNPQQQKVIRRLYADYQPSYFIIESVGYQLAIIQQLRNAPTSSTDLYVETKSPELLDQTIRSLMPYEAFLVRENMVNDDMALIESLKKHNLLDESYLEGKGAYVKENGCYIARILGDKDFFTFACERQGYCRVIGPRGVTQEYSIPVKEYKPVRDKMARFSVVAIQMEAEKILFRKNAPYLQTLVPEILRFPLGANDDQCDTCAMACEEVTSGGLKIAIAFSGGETKQELPAMHKTDDEAVMRRQEELARLLGDLRSFGGR